MELRVLWVGKGRDRLLAELAQRYQARLERFTKVVTAHVPEATGEGRSPDEARRLEAERLRKVLVKWARGRSGLMIALDEGGKLLTSAKLADEIRRGADRGLAHATFVIGGDDGLDPALCAEADLVLSLSRMTFTHEFARAVLMEQVYRAHAIIAGHPYHRE